MIQLLWLLIGSGIIFAVILFFTSLEDKGRKNNQDSFFRTLERALYQVKDQLFSLEIDVKKTVRVSSELRKEFIVLKELGVLGQPGQLPQKNAIATEALIIKQALDGSQLEDTQKKLKALQLENISLRNRVEELTKSLEQLSSIKDSQDTLITQLREREEKLRSQFEIMQNDLRELKAGLEEATRSKLEMKEKLFKLKIVSADYEKELDRLRSENKELMGTITYERKNV